MKTPEVILQQDKYKGLKGLLLICDAMDEHSSQFTSQIEELTKEVERLKAENKNLTASYNALDEIYLRTLKRLEVSESENDRYREALEDCVNRMKRARKILTGFSKEPNSWQMLNAEKYESLLHPLVKEGE